MQLKDYRADYYLFSTKTSEIVRQLSFAGIALIWVLKPNALGFEAIPRELLLPAALFVLTLAFDLLQGAYGTLLWGCFCRFEERRGVEDEDELDVPAYYNWPTIVFFWGKVLLLITAFSLTLSYICSLLKLT